MKQDIFHRLFDRLNDLVPNLETVEVGNAFYAAPRITGDMSIYCSVSSVKEGVIELEIAHDQVINREDQPAPWMVFRVDTLNRAAELLALHDEWRYEVVYSDENRTNPRRFPLNLYAVNWLSIMINLHSAFQPVASSAMISN